MEGFAGIIGMFIGILVVALSQRNSHPRTKSSPRAERDNQLQPSRDLDPRQKAVVRDLDRQEKAIAFDRFISWAQRQAQVQGVLWSSLEGQNDYQRARQVFQDTNKWKQLRQSTLAKYPRCLKCGTTQNLQVDHVVPMVRRPDMFNHESNLQTLCGPCNRRKGVKIIDYRPVQKAAPKPSPSPPTPRRSPRKPWRSESEIVAIRDGIPVFSRYGDGPTDKQKEILAVLSLSPEERRQHIKRVAQELKAERLAAQEARRAKQ